MRFLPVFLDVTTRDRRADRLVGGRDGQAQALARGRRQCALVLGQRDVAEEVALAGAPPGRLELSLADPLRQTIPSSARWSPRPAVTLDEAVAAKARAGNVPINVVDRADLSTFIFPATIDRGEVVVAIGTGGASPVLARRIRERIEAALPARIGDLAALLGRYRGQFAKARHASQSLRRFWESVIDGPIGAAALAGRWREAELALARAIESTRHPQTEPGVVYLVGAGPGDPDLLTLRALQALQGADVIFYDELVTAGILDRARRDADRVFVGKRRGQPGLGQDEINRRLVETARAGRNVVRLKGGDPLVFGRGGEELEHLRAADVPVVIVPGVTAVLGCAAEAGLPLTYRNESSRLTLVTAHRADAAAATDWAELPTRRRPWWSTWVSRRRPPCAMV